MNAAPLWTAADAGRATGGRIGGDWSITGIASDSRCVQRGDLFVALKGPSFDGHDFVAEALDRGAAAALVTHRPAGVSEDAPVLCVDDTLVALGRLASAARERSGARVVAITGSVGKTGAKEALGRVLSAQAPTFASPASFNNQFGVPLSLAALPPEARYGVFELGMNHPGEIAPLARMVRPDVALITTVEAVHTEHFPSVGAIADAKAEIFEGMGEAGVAVLNRNNALCQRLSAAARAHGVRRIVYFGNHPHAAVRLIDAELAAESSSVAASVEGETISYHLRAPGRHWVTLSLGVLAAVLAAGADVGRAAASLGEVTPLPGRGARHRVVLDGEDFTLIDESYNANPISMRAAIEVLGASVPRSGGRRIAVLGDMLELGSESAERHAELSEALINAGVDLVFTVGPNMACLRDAVPAAMRGGHAARSDDIVSPVVAAVVVGDVVMVKGSLGSRMAPIVAALLGREGAPATRAAGSG